MQQIGAYGFRSAAPKTAPARDLGVVARAAASTIGSRWLARLDEVQHATCAGSSTRRGSPHVHGAFLGYRVFAVAAPAVLISLLAFAGGGLGPRSIVAAVWLGFFGWLSPKWFVKRCERQRIELVDRDVPELVDLLVTTVEAGVAFAGGLQLAARGIKGPLGEELRLVLQEQSLGLTPEEALRNLSHPGREPLRLRAFTQALIQGESLGVSIGKALRDLAVDMRQATASERRGARAEYPDEDPLPAGGARSCRRCSSSRSAPCMMRVTDFFGST